MQRSVRMENRNFTLIVWLVAALGCGAGSEDSSASDSLEEAIARMDAAAEAQCMALETCYPALNEENDGFCRGPTTTGSLGWGVSSSEEERAAERACIDKVYVREPAALLEFLDCFRQEYLEIKSCIEEKKCPADITECDERGNKIERECKKAAAPTLSAVFETECGYWDD